MLLAIDTATRIASLALHDGVSLRYEETWDAGREHTTQVLPRLVAALETLRVRVEDLSAVAVAVGPGSFTGLRVGVSIAKGLCVACGIPLIGIPTLDILATAQGADRRPLAAVVQAGRGRICAAVYRWRGGWRRREGPFLTTWEGLMARFTTPFLVCGEVDARGQEALGRLEGRAAVLSPAHSLRRAGFLAELAWERLGRGETDDPTALTPLYLQHPAEG